MCSCQQVDRSIFVRDRAEGNMRGSSTQPACYCPQQRQAGSFFRIGGENRAAGETIPIGQRMIFAGLLVIEEQPRLSAFRARSEEHTSELQSLMRIPYSVFCLKKYKLT